MKTKSAIFLIGLIVCCLMSCSKNNASTIHSDNYWILAGNTCNVVSCSAPYENILANNYSTTNTNNYSQLTFNFSQDVATAGNRTYRAVDNSHYTSGTADNVVVISGSNNIGSASGANYTTTNAGGTVTVTISNTGKVTAVGTGISMKNDNAPYDNATITFNLIQTQ